MTFSGGASILDYAIIKLYNPLGINESGCEVSIAIIYDTYQLIGYWHPLSCQGYSCIRWSIHEHNCYATASR